MNLCGHEQHEFIESIAFRFSLVRGLDMCISSFRLDSIIASLRARNPSWTMSSAPSLRRGGKTSLIFEDDGFGLIDRDEDADLVLVEAPHVGAEVVLRPRVVGLIDLIDVVFPDSMTLF